MNEKAMSKQAFFCFNAALGTVHEDLRNFHCCWQHKFSIKALLCNTQYFCIVDSDVQFNHTHTQNALLCFHCNNG
jgi:hypothetical protein